MSNVMTIDQRLADMNLTVEDRARAMRAAHAGEAVGMMLNTVAQTVAGLVRRWRDWSEARRSMTSLKRLDSRLLADIGLSPATLGDSLFRKNRDFGKSSVEVEISDMMPARIAANQDHRDQRTAA